MINVPQNINYLFNEINKKVNLCFWFFIMVSLFILLSLIVDFNCQNILILLSIITIFFLSVLLLSKILLSFHKDNTDFYNKKLIKIHKNKFKKCDVFIEELIFESWKFHGFIKYKTQTKIKEKNVCVTYYKFLFIPEISNFNKLSD